MNASIRSIMKNRLALIFLSLIFGSTATLPSALAQPAQAKVQVKVSKRSTEGKTTYRYRVINNSAYSIVSFGIGYDYWQGAAELGEIPSGWTLEQGLASGSTTSPRGWIPKIITTEESSVVSLEWRSSNGAQFDITPGNSAVGFSATVDEASPEYENAHFDVVLSNSTHISAPMVPDENPNEPVARPLSISTTKNKAAPISLLADNPEGGELEYTITEQPSHGKLSGVAPDLTYTPDDNFLGEDTLKFKVTNKQAESNVASVMIRILPGSGGDEPAKGNCQGCSSANGLMWTTLLGLFLLPRLTRRRSSRPGI